MWNGIQHLFDEWRTYCAKWIALSSEYLKGAIVNIEPFHKHKFVFQNCSQSLLNSPRTFAQATINISYLPCATFQSAFYRWMMFKPLKFFERAQVRIAVVETNDETNGNKRRFFVQMV